MLIADPLCHTNCITTHRQWSRMLYSPLLSDSLWIHMHLFPLAMSETTPLRFFLDALA
jgi:hypothetical protein